MKGKRLARLLMLSVIVVGTAIIATIALTSAGFGGRVPAESRSRSSATLVVVAVLGGLALTVAAHAVGPLLAARGCRFRILMISVMHLRFDRFPRPRVSFRLGPIGQCL